MTHRTIIQHLRITVALAVFFTLCGTFLIVMLEKLVGSAVLARIERLLTGSVRALLGGALEEGVPA